MDSFFEKKKILSLKNTKECGERCFLLVFLSLGLKFVNPAEEGEVEAVEEEARPSELQEGPSQPEDQSPKDSEE